MIRKWRNRILIFGLITVFLAVIGFYLYINVADTNKRMESLKNDGILVKAEMRLLSGVAYTDVGYHRWGYVLPIATQREGEIDGITITLYSKQDYEDMDGMVEVYYMFLEDGTLFTFDKTYTDNFTPWSPSQSIAIWVLAFITFAIAVYYLIRNIIILYILKKGEESIGRFEEAFHAKLGSNRYYKVKYTFIRDGEQVTAVSQAIYEGREVDKLKAYGSFMVRYIGKNSVIDQKL